MMKAMKNIYEMVGTRTKKDKTSNGCGVIRRDKQKRECDTDSCK